ncbi:hypothetical protein B0H19DRAFT_1130501 [Mycena capillaripes]|nr:hypothetical protein B0H19DRAFT_1130501 [Mycena capillaripes]
MEVGFEFPDRRTSPSPDLALLIFVTPASASASASASRTEVKGSRAPSALLFRHKLLLRRRVTRHCRPSKWLPATVSKTWQWVTVNGLATEETPTRDVGPSSTFTPQPSSCNSRRRPGLLSSAYAPRYIHGLDCGTVLLTRRSPALPDDDGTGRLTLVVTAMFLKPYTSGSPRRGVLSKSVVRTSWTRMGTYA